jgi:hypothetical protein
MSLTEELNRLIDEYTRWLKQGISLREVGDWVEVTTPYLDRHNDSLQFYVRRENGTYVLSDDGYIVQDLRSSGCDLDTPKRRELLAVTLNGFGVSIENDALIARAAPETFSQKKHGFVQAMLAVNDLFYLAEPHVASLFAEDVQAWMELAEIRFSQRVKLTGRSGYDHLFDFIIPRSRRQPERLVRTINRPSRDTAEAVTFSWIDVRENRPETQAYAFLNDSEREPAAAVFEALRAYGVRPVRWSERDQHREELAV